MAYNRKRTRSIQDEGEFMPLSKRINNLHINNLLYDDSNVTFAPIGWNGLDSKICPQNCYIPDSVPNSPEENVELLFNLPYAPPLNESQNPHYFNINKVLYEMYLERKRRGFHQI